MAPNAPRQAECACPVGPTCQIRRATREGMASHLIREHGWSPEKAMEEVRRLLSGDPETDRVLTGSDNGQEAQRTDPGGIRRSQRVTTGARLLPATLQRTVESPVGVGITPTTTEPPMLVPRSNCGYCHRRDGTHSKGCKKTVCKLCARLAPRKCRFHGGAPDPKGPSVHAKRTVSASVGDLARLEAAIAEHERKATVLREAREILKESAF